jgi:hypothetical protein
VIGDKYEESYCVNGVQSGVRVPVVAAISIRVRLSLGLGQALARCDDVGDKIDHEIASWDLFCLENETWCRHDKRVRAL